MAFAISTPTSSLWRSSSSYSGGKPPLFVLSNYAVSVRKNAIYRHVKGIPQLGIGPFAEWNGLKQLRISISQYSVKMGKNRKGKGKKGVYASLFGVGAPEALVIGVVALLVFGPKGLAEVARNLGKTLRAFQPTIRELQDVSREFKSSLEREIGLDEIDRPVPRDTPKPTPQDIPQELKANVEPTESPVDKTDLSNQTSVVKITDETPSESGAYTADEYLKVTEAQLKGTLSQLQKEQQENKDKPENQSQTKTSSQDAPKEASPSETQESNALQEDVPKSKTEI